MQRKIHLKKNILRQVVRRDTEALLKAFVPWKFVKVPRRQAKPQILRFDLIRSSMLKFNKGNLSWNKIVSIYIYKTYIDHVDLLWFTNIFTIYIYTFRINTKRSWFSTKRIPELPVPICLPVTSVPGCLDAFWKLDFPSRSHFHGLRLGSPERQGKRQWE